MSKKRPDDTLRALPRILGEAALQGEVITNEEKPRPETEPHTRKSLGAGPDRMAAVARRRDPARMKNTKTPDRSYPVHVSWLLRIACTVDCVKRGNGCGGATGFADCFNAVLPVTRPSSWNHWRRPQRWTLDEKLTSRSGSVLEQLARQVKTNRGTSGSVFMAPPRGESSMRRIPEDRFLSIALAAAASRGSRVLGIAAFLPPMPKLAGKIEHGALEHGGRTRTWIAYLPAKPAARPALVIALHGVDGHGGAGARRSMGMTSISLRISMVSSPSIRRVTKATGTIAR